MLGAKAGAISTKVGHHHLFCERVDEIMVEGRSQTLSCFGVAARMYVQLIYHRSIVLILRGAHCCICNTSNSGHSVSNAYLRARPAQSATRTLESEPIRKYSVKSRLFSNSSDRTSPFAATRNARAA